MTKLGVSTRSEKFTSLESCRGICAVIVALSHFSANSHILDWSFIQNGRLGVTYFFVLSGFVMMHAYGDRLKSTTDFAPFVIKRLGRLYPLHFFMLIVLLALECLKLVMVRGQNFASGVAPFEGANSLSSLVGNVFLVNGIGFYSDFTWNIPSWSISTEFWTYLVFFAVMVSGRRYAAFGIGLVILSGFALGLNQLLGSPVDTIEGRGAIKCLYCFFLGMLTYQLIRRPLARSRVSSHWEWLALLLVVLAFSDILPLGSVSIPILFAATITILSFEKGLASSMLRWSPMVYLGTISYSIYMVHIAIGTVINAMARVLDSRWQIPLVREGVGDSGFLIDSGNRFEMDLLAIAYLASIIAMATLTYFFIEVPFRDRFNAVARRMEAAKRIPGSEPRENFDVDPASRSIPERAQ